MQKLCPHGSVVGSVYACRHTAHSLINKFVGRGNCFMIIPLFLSLKMLAAHQGRLHVVGPDGWLLRSPTARRGGRVYELDPAEFEEPHPEARLLVAYLVRRLSADLALRCLERNDALDGAGLPLCAGCHRRTLGRDRCLTCARSMCVACFQGRANPIRYRCGSCAWRDE